MSETFLTVAIDRNYTGGTPDYTTDQKWLNGVIKTLADFLGLEEEQKRWYNNLLSGHCGGHYDDLYDVDKELTEFSRANPDLLLAIHWDTLNYAEEAGTHFYWRGKTQGDTIKIEWPEPIMARWERPENRASEKEGQNG